MFKLKIAIYTGVIPSTTFIERLIVGVSQRDVVVYLFGKKDTHKRYVQSHIVCSTYSGKLNKLLRLLWFSIILFLFKNKQKKQLDHWIKSRKANTKMLMIKCYPVLWYKPDVFHLQWAKSIEDWIWVQKFGIKLVVSLRGSQVNIEPLGNAELANMYKRLFPKVDAFHAVSNSIAKEAEKYGVLIDKVKVVYSGLLKNHFATQNNTFNKEQDCFQILSVGRNHWVKGYSYALDACKLLKNSGFNFHYTIVGVKDAEQLEFQKNELELNENVTFVSKLPLQKVLDLTQKSHLVLLPSIEEGIANVILEAMQLGKVVLTTNCGGMDEVVHDGINGFVVPIRDSVAMCENIMKIASLPQDEILNITSNAFKTIENQHSEEKMVNDMVALYNAVLQNTSIS